MYSLEHFLFCLLLVSVCKTVIRRSFQLAILTSYNFFFVSCYILIFCNNNNNNNNNKWAWSRTSSRFSLLTILRRVLSS